MSDHQRASKKPEDTAQWRSSGLHRAVPPDIVVVDDDAATLEFMLALLTSEGMRARGFLRSDEAFEAITQEPPDVVALDLRLADARGEDLARKLRSDPSHAAVRFVAITGATEPESLQWFDAYLRKPADPTLIVTLLRELAATRRAP